MENTKSAKSAKKVALSEVIDVQSCIIGKLIWKSKRTGYKIVWNEYGEKNPMTVEDLLDMRNGDRRFFERNWVILDGDRAQDIMDYLQISKYYTVMSDLDKIDDIFTHNPEEIAAIIEKFGDGMKETIARRAAVLISDGKIDSLKVTSAVGTATGFDLNAE